MWNSHMQTGWERYEVLETSGMLKHMIYILFIVAL